MKLNKWLFVLVFLITGCSSFGSKYEQKIEEMPVVKRKIANIEQTCLKDVEKGLLNVRFSSWAERGDFCSCMLWGFSGLTNFSPLSAEYAQSISDSFDRAPQSFVIDSVDNMHRGYFDLLTTIQNLNRDKSWKNHYENNYLGKVNYCTRNATYGIAL